MGSWVPCLVIPQQIGRGSGWRCPAAGSGLSCPLPGPGGVARRVAGVCCLAGPFASRLPVWHASPGFGPDLRKRRVRSRAPRTGDRHVAQRASRRLAICQARMTRQAIRRDGALVLWHAGCLACEPIRSRRFVRLRFRSGRVSQWRDSSPQLRRRIADARSRLACLLPIRLVNCLPQDVRRARSGPGLWPGPRCQARWVRVGCRRPGLSGWEVVGGLPQASESPSGGPTRWAVRRPRPSAAAGDHA